MMWFARKKPARHGLTTLPLLANHAQADFRNKLMIASSSRARWIQTKDN
jgi:hypothetical protein